MLVSFRLDRQSEVGRGDAIDEPALLHDIDDIRNGHALSKIPKKACIGAVEVLKAVIRSKIKQISQRGRVSQAA
jgi:hypothetical protein